MKTLSGQAGQGRTMDEAAGTCFTEAARNPRGIDRFALSFIFELDIVGGGEPAKAVRIANLAAQLDGAGPMRARRRRKASGGSKPLQPEQIGRALIEPLRSYHDDVTLSPVGTGGRPLAFLAQPPREDEPDRRCTLIRPARWRYSAEGREVELITPESARRIALEYRDIFFAFDDGSITYALSFFPAGPEAGAVDEYALIQLEQLLDDPRCSAALRADLRWEHNGQDLSLAEFAAARYNALEKSKETAPNAVRDLIGGLILEGGERLTLPDWSNLTAGLVGIEHAPWLEAALRLADGPAAAGQTVAPHDADESSSKGAASASGPESGGGAPTHLDPCVPEAEAEALILAGLVQGIPDFPFQDRSEIADSLAPVHTDKISYAVYFNPRFLTEIGADWRTLREGAPLLGQCPYLLLTWVVALHDARVARKTEDWLDTLFFGGSDQIRVEPLRDLKRSLRASRNQFLPGPGRALRQNIETRYALFSGLAIHRSQSIFRYAKESAVLNAINEASGARRRFADSADKLSRYESILEDAQAYGAAQGEKRMNLILSLIAIFGLTSVFADLAAIEWWPFGPGDVEMRLTLIGGAFGLVLLGLLIRRWLP